MRRRRAPALDTVDWPRLSAFFRGYLHQDAELEHTSIEAAFDQFWSDASEDERAGFAAEWKTLLGRVEGRAWSRVARRLEPLGLAWMPQAGSGFSRLRQHIGRTLSGSLRG